MPTQLLNIPPKLIKHILALGVLSHQDAPSLSQCRQTCRAGPCAQRLHRAIPPCVNRCELCDMSSTPLSCRLLDVYDPFVIRITTLCNGTTTRHTRTRRCGCSRCRCCNTG